VALGEKQAIELANKAANEGGYTLTHASPTNRGHLGVADIYIDDWYYSDKTSTYSDLENGKIELAMTVNAEGDNTTCGNPPLAIDSEHSVIGINVRLPLRR
jgi:hypothetical protein